jgi:uncharacterized protein YciI
MKTRSRLYLLGIFLVALSAAAATSGDRGTPAPAATPVPAAPPAPAANPASPAAPGVPGAPGPAAAPASQPGQGTAEMATYFVALLFKGSTASSSPAPDMTKIQQADVAYIQKMFLGGKIVVAGPFQDGGDMTGMFVLRAASLEEAREICKNDPAVQAGVLLYDLHPWRAPKALNIGVEPQLASR